MRGRFITIEGIDGAGKSTQTAVIEETLRARGLEVVRSREPGGTPLCEQIRQILLHQAMDPRTETLLFFASRAEHLAAKILPALDAGRWVLCDRFTDSTYAYQTGGRKVSPEDVLALERWTQRGLQPDRTVLFDVPPELAAERLARARAADKFEAESVAFFAAVRNAYLDRAAADPGRFLVVDATRPIAAISEDLRREFAQWG